MALGEIYGDCKAETNADEGGDTKDGELCGDDSIEVFKLGECKSVGIKVKASLPILLQQEEVLMVRPLGWFS